MKHIKTLNTKRLQNTVKKGGCGECQTSCQSACKTSCTVGNQSCEHNKLRRQSKNDSQGRMPKACGFHVFTESLFCGHMKAWHTVRRSAVCEMAYRRDRGTK